MKRGLGENRPSVWTVWRNFSQHISFRFLFFFLFLSVSALCLLCPAWSLSARTVCAVPRLNATLCHCGGETVAKGWLPCTCNPCPAGLLSAVPGRPSRADNALATGAATVPVSGRTPGWRDQTAAQQGSAGERHSPSLAPAAPEAGSSRELWAHFHLGTGRRV